jgi:uncharacterized membrane protein
MSKVFNEKKSLKIVSGFLLAPLIYVFVCKYIKGNKLSSDLIDWAYAGILAFTLFLALIDQLFSKSFKWLKKLIDWGIRKLTNGFWGPFLYCVFMGFAICRLICLTNDSIYSDIFNINYETAMPALLGAFITVYVAFITFILVAVQLSSTQFSPRILRMFFPRDPQIFFMSVFFLLCISLFCLVPINLSCRFRFYDLIVFSASLLCVPLFFLFVTLLVRRLNVTNITKRIKERTIFEISEMYNDSTKNLNSYKFDEIEFYTNKGRDFSNLCNKNLTPIYALNNVKEWGFIEEYDNKEIEKLKPYLTQGINSIHLTLAPGQYIHVGDIIAYVEPLITNDALKSDLIDVFNDIYKCSEFRSHDMDIQFGIRQLVDIAVKSVSAAINDPTTCITSIYNITDVVIDYMMHKRHSNLYEDCESQNIYLREFNFSHIIDQCYDQIYTWSKNDVDVTKNIIRSMRLLITHAKDLDDVKIICDELIDLDIYHGVVKKFLNHNNPDSLMADLKAVNELLTYEGVLILRDELLQFCRTVFSFDYKPFDRDTFYDSIDMVKKNVQRVVNQLDQLETNHQISKKGKTTHTKKSYRETLEYVLDMYVSLNNLSHRNNFYLIF